MIETIKNTDIDKLLGLEKPEEAIQAQSDMAEVITAQAIQRLSEGVNDDEKQIINNLLEGEDINAIDSIVERYPQFLQYIEEESYSYKKGGLEAQLFAMREEVSKENNSNSPILLNFLNEIDALISLINTDSQVDFESHLNEYNNLKNIISQIQNG